MAAGEAATAQAQALVDAALSYLPPSESPWLALGAALTTLEPSLEGNGFGLQCWCQLALIACSCILLLSGLSVKMWQGQLWLYRVRKGYVVPHYSTTFCFAISGMQALMLGFIYRNVQRSQGITPPDFSLWLALTWIPGVLGFSNAGWSLAVSHAIHVQSTQNKLSSPLLRSGFLNGLGILAPICVCASLASLSYFAQQHYHQTINTATTLLGFVGEGALTYNGTFPTATLAEVVGLTAEVMQATDDYIYCFRAIFLTYAVWLALAMVFLILVAAIHLRTLHQSSIDKAFEAQYKSLVVITLAFVTMGAATLSTLIFESAMARDIITLSTYAQAGALLPPYIYIVFGLPLSFFLLAKSFKNDPRMAPPPRRKTPSEMAKSSFGQVSFVIPTKPRAHAAYPMMNTPSPDPPHPALAGHWRSQSASPNFVYPPSTAFVQPTESAIDFSEARVANSEVETVKWDTVKGWFRSSK